MTATDREQVFVSRDPRAFFIRLKNLPEGAYRVRRYGITREGGSSYDAWVRMGAPSPLNEEERQRLLALSGPVYHTERLRAENGELQLKASLAPQEVWLIRVQPV